MGRAQRAMLVSVAILLALAMGCGGCRSAPTESDIDHAIVAGDWQKLIELAEAWHAHGPASPVPAFAAGETQRRLGRSDLVHRTYRSMLPVGGASEVRDPVDDWALGLAARQTDSAYACQMAAAILCLNHNYHAALGPAGRAAKLTPRDPWSWIALGTACLGSQQSERAVEAFGRALALDDRRPEALCGRAQAYLQRHHADQAIADASRAAALNARDDWPYIVRGTAYQAKSLPHRAIADFDRAADLDAERPDAFHCRAAAYVALGDNDRAIKDYDRAIELDPSDLRAMLGRGDTFRLMGSKDRAAADYRAVITRVREPRGEFDYYARGAAHLGLGEYGEAKAELTQAIKFAPGFVEAYVLRGEANMALGLVHETVWDFSKAVSLDPGSAAAYRDRGRAYLRKGDYAKAVDDLTRAIGLDPWAAGGQAYGDRGAAQLMLGRKSLAERDFEHVKRMDPARGEAIVRQYRETAARAPERR